VQEGSSWLAPGPLSLEPGSIPLQPTRTGDAIEVDVLEEQGRLVRVRIHLEHARFTAWTERAQLYGIVVRDTRVKADAFAEAGIEATLHRGARVRRLAHDRDRTRVRYYGQVEIEGWIPDEAIAERGPARDNTSRVWHGGETLSLLPGTVFRSEPKWSAHALATLADGYFAEKVKDLDDTWVLAEYEDGDVRVRGYISKHDPPGTLHRPHAPEVVAAPAPNAKLADGTCLYAREGGEPIGAVVGETEATLEPGGTGWFTAAFDTPWGPIAFSAKGPTDTELERCP